MTGEEAKAILKMWGCRARGSQKAHYLVATRYSFRQDVVTIGIVILTAVTGSALFATLSNTDIRFKFALAVLAVVSAILAGFDRSKRYLENAEKHRQAGASWTDVVQRTEVLDAQLPTHSPADVDRQIADIGKEIDDVTTKSPQIPERTFRRLGLDDTYSFRVNYASLFSRILQKLHWRR